MRKLVMLLLCIAIACFAYRTVADGVSFGSSFRVPSYKEISSSSKQIDTLIGQLTNINDVQFVESQNSLTSAIKQYKNAKEEYDEIASTTDIGLVDTYDVDFLWTTIGNYGTEEGISLRFNITKSVSSILESQAYTMCDLNFTVTGEYIPITDFIYDIEDDNKLGFEISNFSLSKNGDDLQATFVVRNIPINNKNLTEITPSLTTVDESGKPVSNDNSVDSSDSLDK